MSKQRQQALEHRKAGTRTVVGGRRVGGVLTVLILATVALAVGAILLLKEGRPPTSRLANPAPSSSATAGGSAAGQLQAALAAKQPALVFMHSTTCKSCIDMMAVVDQVYPEFASQIALVDVDVYDEANGPLMDSLALRYIPTVVVFSREGKASQNVGAMKADAFRAFLRQRALGG